LLKIPNKYFLFVGLTLLFLQSYIIKLSWDVPGTVQGFVWVR